MAKITNVGVHNLSPGMVTTELLMSGADTPTAKFFINCLGEIQTCGSGCLGCRVIQADSRQSMFH
jgi:hypothetical protein